MPNYMQIGDKVFMEIDPLQLQEPPPSVAKTKKKKKATEPKEAHIINWSKVPESHKVWYLIIWCCLFLILTYPIWVQVLKVKK